MPLAKGALNAVACGVLTSYRQYDIRHSRQREEPASCTDSPRAAAAASASPQAHVLPKTSQEREGNHLRRTTVG